MNNLSFTLVTPSFNRKKFLEEAILSVLEQDIPGLEYIIIDGQSNDGSYGVIKKYSHRLSYWCSEPDQGQYNALNKGFRLSTGEIMGWLNSDDILLPGALKAVARIFNDCPEIDWITGLSSNIDSNGFIYQSKQQYRYSRESFLMGPPRGIQQESTFWRRSLWVRAGGALNEEYKLAADYELWCRFFEQTNLFHINLPFGAFRKHGDQVTRTRQAAYMREMEEMQKKFRLRLPIRHRVIGYFKALFEIFVNDFLINSKTVTYELHNKRYRI